MNWQILLSSFAQAHLTLLLSKGTIFDRFWPKRLSALRSCPMCLGFWTAGIVSIFVGWKLWLGIAAIGHLIYLIREKYLPCAACSAPELPAFKIS